MSLCSWIGANAIELISGSATVAAAAAAFLSWRASSSAASAAAALTRIEQARRLADLQPRFEASIVRQPSGDRVLAWALVGPSEVLTLDKVTIRTRGDGVDWAAATPADLRERIPEFTWGPGQFRLGVDQSVSATQSRDFVDVEQGTEVLVTVDPSVAPPWWEQKAWDTRYQRQPMRLAFECFNGTNEWIVHLNVNAKALLPPQQVKIIY